MHRRSRGRFHRTFNSQPAPVNLRNLYEQIRDEKMIVEQLAHYWVCQYRESDNEAYHFLLSFLMDSMGFDKSILNINDLENSDMETLITKLTKKAKSSEDYPIVSKTKQFRSFYLNFQHFWIYLVTEAADLLYDESLLTFLSNWLSSLTFSTVKAIRHTATLAILSVAQALIDILSKETNDLIRVQTFIKTEMNNSDTQRLQLLQKQEQEILERQKTLTKELTDIYNDVIKVRAFDIIMEIRAICMQGLHYLSDKLPELFLNTKTLQLLSYALYDKAPEVRVKALEFISNVLTDENSGKITEFLLDNRLRVLEMSHDIENKICVLAINICTKLSQFIELAEEELNIVACLVWAESEDIRNSACNFLLQAIFKDKLPLDHWLGTTLSIDQGKDYDWEQGIMKIVNFHKDFGETEMCRVEIVVQTLWNKTGVVKSWDTMCELLKRGEKVHATALEETDKKIIIYMLIAGLKYICSSQEKKQKNIMINLTSTLLSQLPSLLIFYSQDLQTLSELVKIPAFLDLSSLAAKDLKEPFQSLLNVLMDLQSKIKNCEVSLKLIQSIVKLAREPHSMQKEAKSEVIKLVSEISLGVKESLKQYILECEENRLEEFLIKGESLISVLDICDDLGEESISDLIHMLTQYLSDSISNTILVQNASGLLFYYHLWSLNKIAKHPETVESYTQLRDTTIEIFTAVLAKPNTSTNIKFLLFKYICETLIVISSQSTVGCPLYFEANKDIWTTIEEFMLTTPINQTQPQIPPPAKSFYKFGAKDESSKEDADLTSQTICLLVSRIICFCPSLTTSHLPSSFLAHFGTCNLKSISSIVRQVILHFKTKESQQSGVFNDSSLFFSIILESLIKAMGDGSENEILNMKELAKKFVNVMGQGAMRPKQADKLLGFIIDGISFAFSDKDNFSILDGLIVFLQKNYLSPNQMKELYERVNRDADIVENKIRQVQDEDVNLVMYPIKHFLYSVSKIVGANRQPPVLPSEKTKKQIIKLREQLYKNKEGETVAVKKSAFSIVEEFKKAVVEQDGDTLVVGDSVKLPVKRNAAEALADDQPRKSIKKSSIVLNDFPPATKKSGIRIEESITKAKSVTKVRGTTLQDSDFNIPEADPKLSVNEPVKEQKLLENEPNLPESQAKLHEKESKLFETDSKPLDLPETSHPPRPVIKKSSLSIASPSAPQSALPIPILIKKY